MDRVCQALTVPERRVCKVLGQPRSTQRYRLQVADDEAALTAAIESLAKRYGRYGYRRVTALLRADGWRVNHKRVERIWRREGLKVPARQKKRGRLWLNDGSCIRLRPEHRNHVWTYDIVHERTQDGKTLRLLMIVDEYNQECLAIRVGRRLKAKDELSTMAGHFLQHGVPQYLRSDNGSEMMAKTVWELLGGLGVDNL